MAEKRKMGGELMTQLIGAICEKYTSVVLLSDRQTERAGLVLERGPKGTEIAKNAVTLTAGTAHEPAIVDSVRDKYLSASPVPKMETLIEELVDRYHDRRLHKIRNEILRPRGFDSLDEFYAKQRAMHESLVLEMNMDIEKCELGLLILVGCVDTKGAHLSYIDDPGTECNYDTIAFFCPGMGREQAESTFVMYDYSPDLSVEDTLRIAYLAKERGRMAGGVGVATDGWIISKEGVNAVPEEKFKELREYWKGENVLRQRYIEMGNTEETSRYKQEEGRNSPALTRKAQRTES